MSGMLYLVPTPIGNLGDISTRCRETLESVDFIAAEDTRHSIKLLNHFDIKTPMTSYHEDKKAEAFLTFQTRRYEGRARSDRSCGCSDSSYPSSQAR